MKKKLFLGIILSGLVFILGACGQVQAAQDDGPPGGKVPPAPDKYLVVVTGEDFGKQSDVIREAEVKTGDTFTISVDSNATTGFSWTEQATISDPKLLTQTAHEYVAPGTDKPATGMAGSEEWIFKAEQAGTVKVSLSYDRPWDGGEKGARTFELTVTIK